MKQGTITLKLDILDGLREEPVQITNVIFISKKVIIKEIERKINDVIDIEHDHLELWKIEIDVLEKLKATELVSEHWEEQPERKHLHVILTNLSLSDGNISAEVITNHTSIIDDEEELISDGYVE
ncbi:hypothetical protein RclHR1_06720005 [Rhizophagus clarus]|uniref:Uncharacterized protein n=1 Tax=Rhizophagus clarus TaxID=94130 RepID=A0A2Z6SJQ9_9GLOM|nr:hypothetical protein RclHR1_06720005 [Rhizophagus clarus]